MQRKSAVQTQNSVAEMHFAVTPYEVEYSVPNDEIYSLYFQKGLQILGTTQYPIENHQKLKRLELPIQNNIIPFRLFSDRNAEYQWSIYKRVNEMQEFLESKKINLKDILKKQPEKRHQPLKNQVQRKQSGGKSDIRKSQSKQVRNTSIRGSDLRGTQVRNTQTKNSEQNIPQKSGDGSSQPKRVIYNQSITSEIGQFTFKFYLFKALSSQQLSKTIEQKAKQGRIPLSQISPSKLQEIAESDAQKQLDVEKTSQQNIESAEAIVSQTEIEPTQAVKQTIQAVEQTFKPAQKQEVKNQEKTVEIVQQTSKPQQVHQQIIEGTEQPFSESPNQNIQQVEAFFNDTNVSNVEYPDVQQHVESQPQGQVKQNIVSKEQNVQKQTNQAQIMDVKVGTDKKKIVVILLIIIGLYLVSYFNLFNQGNSTGEALGKKGKKQKFSNRKKFVGS